LPISRILVQSPIFEKGVATNASIEGALQQYRKGFRLDQFGTVMP
jgi:hypothetical protein